MQLGHLAGVLLAQSTASVRQHPQHRELVIGDHRSQPGHAGADQRHGVDVGGIGLASLTSREHSRPGRELRRHVDHVLALGQEPHRDVSADPVASLDRPDPFWPLLHVLNHRCEAVGIGAEATTTEDLLIGGHHLDRHRPLVRVHPDHDSLACRHSLLLRSAPVGRVERAPLL
jgi:hypothetical protein